MGSKLEQILDFFSSVFRKTYILRSIQETFQEKSIVGDKSLRFL